MGGALRPSHQRQPKAGGHGTRASLGGCGGFMGHGGGLGAGHGRVGARHRGGYGPAGHSINRIGCHGVECDKRADTFGWGPGLGGNPG